MNKKTLFLVLLLATFISPIMVSAVTAPAMANNVKTALVAIGASIVIIGWVIAGILYLTSAGSPERTGTAKKALIAAVIGTLLIILAVGAQEFVSTLFGLGGSGSSSSSSSTPNGQGIPYTPSQYEP